MEYEHIIDELSKKIYKPIYLLMGEEPYFIDVVCDYISNNILGEAEKAFNQTVVYGKETNAADVINACKRYPMMSNYQVVIVKEAQELKKMEDLIYYTEKPLASTILVICHKYKNLDKRKKLFGSIKNNGVILETSRIREDRIPGWIERYLKTKGYSIETDAAYMLSEYVGSDLSKLVNELEKLITVLPKDKSLISANLVEKNIGISKDFNNFELQKAIIKNDIYKANLIISHFGKNPNDNPIQVTITILFSLFSKILLFHTMRNKPEQEVASVLKVAPYFVKDYREGAARFNVQKTLEAISLLREYDMRSKGVNNISADSGDLLKELIYKLLH